jgi:hypothetical protein
VDLLDGVALWLHLPGSDNMLSSQCDYEVLRSYTASCGIGTHPYVHIGRLF